MNNKQTAAIDQADSESLALSQQRLQWYETKLKELLSGYYDQDRNPGRVIELKNQERLLIEERARLVGEIERLRRYSPDSLPKIIGTPLKAMMMLLVAGPKELWRKCNHLSQ